MSSTDNPLMCPRCGDTQIVRVDTVTLRTPVVWSDHGGADLDEEEAFEDYPVADLYVCSSCAVEWRSLDSLEAEASDE